MADKGRKPSQISNYLRPKKSQSGLQCDYRILLVFPFLVAHIMWSLPPTVSNDKSAADPSLRTESSNSVVQLFRGDRFPGYTFWSSDFHIGPIADLKQIFAPLGITVIDKSLSGHCHLPGTCATDLKVCECPPFKAVYGPL